METSKETLIGLLASKELELAEMRLYVAQLESNYNNLVDKYNSLLNKQKIKVRRRRPMGYKRGGKR